MNTNTIEALVSEAKKAWQAGKHKIAADGFYTAYQFYQDQNDEYNAAEMANNLCVAYLQIGKKREALELVNGTDEIFKKYNDPEKQAIALANQAETLETLKQYQQAITCYQKSAEIFKEIGQDDHASYVLKSLALLQIKQGKQLEGIFAMEDSLNSKGKLSIWQRIYRWLLQIPFKLIKK